MIFDSEKEKQELVTLLNAAIFKEISVNDSIVIANIITRIANSEVVKEEKKDDK